MKEHVRLHRFYTSLLMRSIRLVILLGLFGITAYDLWQGILPRYPLFFLSLLMMWEVFFHFSLSKRKPAVKVSENDGKDIFLSYTHEALDTMLSTKTVTELVHKLFLFPQVNFIRQHIGAEKKDVPLADVSLDEIAKSAFSLAKEGNGTYVTTMDIGAAYLLLSEPQTKLLFAKELNGTKLKDILRWARAEYPHEEAFSLTVENTVGDGIGESLVSGWTPETKNYTRNYTEEALHTQGQLLGRDSEYEALQKTLMHPELPNVMLIGEVGVGKEALLSTLASDSFLGRLPKHINHKRVITLMVGPLLAGVSNRGELETRLETIIAELSHAGNIILYIPEFQDLMGESSFDMNVSGALLPYFKDGAIPIVATMTPGNYKSFMEKNSLQEVFTTITLIEPEKSLALQMICAKVSDLEKTRGVIVPYQTILELMTLSPKYLPDDVLPGSAVRLVSDAIQQITTERVLDGKPVLQPSDIIKTVEGKIHASVSSPKKEEKQLLLHLEEKLHERVIGQNHAIQAISEAMRRLRSGVTNHNRPISFLFLGPTGVGKTETAKALASLVYGADEHMLRLDMSEYGDEGSAKRLLGAAPGENDERGELTDRIHENPYTLVLLDEFEKANPHVLDLFLQVLSDGRLTDNKGRTVSFADAIIIATSNAASEFIREAVTNHVPIDKTFQTKLLEQVQTTHLYKPELLNRFDGVIVFTPLIQPELIEVTRMLLTGLQKQFAEDEISLSFSDQVIQKISTEGSDEQFGARPLTRYIQDTIESQLAKLKLEETLSRGKTVGFSVNEQNEIIATVTG